MTHLLGNVLRNLATVLTLAAERIDPQEHVDLWLFSPPTGTNTGDVYLALHRKYHETG